MIFDGLPQETAVHIGWTTVCVGTLTLAVGISTFTKGVLEYRKQNSLKRFEKYLSMIRDFENNKGLQALREDIQGGGEALAKHDKNNKYMFMTFYQEIAMMVQSGLMNMDVAAYLVGFDAREVSLKQEAFICNLWGGTKDPNFALFWDFLNRLDEYVAPYYPVKERIRHECPPREESVADVVGIKTWPVTDFKF